jgi:hypothetical protein
MGISMAVDAVDVVLEREIAAAKKKLVSVAAQRPDHWWTAFELKKKSRNGWTASTMGLALYELLDEEGLEQRADLRLRARV